VGRLEDAVEELYGLPVADFTARRNELARAARSDKDGETAAAITALKKPGVHLWLANRLARDQELAVSRLLGAARDLADAQERALAGADGAGDRLRRDAAEYQRALDQAVRAAAPILAGAGHGGGEEALRRVRDVLSNAARGPAEVQEQLSAGRLVEDPPAPDFGMLAAAIPAAAPSPRRAAPPPQKPRVEPDPPRRRAEDDELASRRRERTAALRRELDGAEAQRERADKTARRLRRRAEAAAAEARAAEAEAATAEAAAAEAKAAVDDVRARLEQRGG
jgi:hypothetical protein